MEVTKQTTEFATADPKQKLLRAGFEPATYGYLIPSQLQSTALPTELSKVLKAG